jgi:hypothetical protein
MNSHESTPAEGRALLASNGLTSLKMLVKPNCTLPRLPKSLLALPKVETVYFDGRAMSKGDFDKLKETLGEKHRLKRQK